MDISSSHGLGFPIQVPQRQEDWSSQRPETRVNSKMLLDHAFGFEATLCANVSVFRYCSTWSMTQAFDHVSRDIRLSVHGSCGPTRRARIHPSDSR
jgi:hypothetical protein